MQQKTDYLTVMLCNFNEGKKNGSWLCYDKHGKIEYQEDFNNDN